MNKLGQMKFSFFLWMPTSIPKELCIMTRR